MNTTQLGRVQLLIMQVLWEHQRATAREITDRINQSESIAHSTVQTLLRGLEEKQAVDHETEGRTFTFFPLIGEADFKQSATQDLLTRVFRGSVEGLVAHLLQSEDVSADELADLRKLINRQAKKKGS